ncbi:hypothetical protein jhhlp_008626 [Lomentospora prolificans]|uniref:Carbohydrate kinase PfkB domain-containing protein n=1 Tax=Lomentospora prolificans TaxID=41688 RepID=A0A2N3MYL9_9PEZI|nr:hypothetical protein jhhlp_008626 [Lomentospora prolificans]
MTATPFVNPSLPALIAKVNRFGSVFTGKGKPNVVLSLSPHLSRFPSVVPTMVRFVSKGDNYGKGTRLTPWAEFNSTVGAGDTFIAGMLYGLICHAIDWDTEAKLKFAINLATLKVQREGFGRLGLDAQDHL